MTKETKDYIKHLAEVIARQAEDLYGTAPLPARVIHKSAEDILEVLHGKAN